MGTLAQRITTRRQQLGLSSTDLANLLGVSLPGVRKWELGNTDNLKHDHLFALADALNVNPRWLALEEGPKIANPAEEARRTALARRRAAQDERERNVWGKLAEAFGKAAMVAIAAITMRAEDTSAATLHNAVMWDRGEKTPIFAELNTHMRAMLVRFVTFLGLFNQFLSAT